MSTIKRGREQYTHTNDVKTILVMVGLPARGKSTIAKEIEKAATSNCRLFNAGQRRRQLNREHTAVNTDQFFDMHNPTSVRDRDQIAIETLDELLHWLKFDRKHKIGILDATNSTKRRRRLILEYLARADLKLKVIFMEVIIESENILEENLYWKVRKSPDYKTNVDKQWCYMDFRRRLKQYEMVYETVAHNEFENISLTFPVSIIKVIDRFEKCHITGSSIPSAVISILFLLRRQYLLIRHVSLSSAKDKNRNKARKPQIGRVVWTNFSPKAYRLKSSP